MPHSGCQVQQRQSLTKLFEGCMSISRLSHEACFGSQAAASDAHGSNDRCGGNGTDDTEVLFTTCFSHDACMM